MDPDASASPPTASLGSSPHTPSARKHPAPAHTHARARSRVNANLRAPRGGCRLQACDTRRGQPGAKRVSYVRSHLVAVQKAISLGEADVRGFFLWSFMDNFEWAFGYARRFGAYHVDYTTLKRTPKPVVPFYRGVCLSNAVTPSAREARTNPFDASALDQHW